jgi:hypothetical protein
VNPAISILIPSRNRPQSLIDCASSILSLAKDPDRVEIVLGLDSDDVVTPGVLPDRFIVSTAERPDTMSEIYERLRKVANAPIMINATDDHQMLTKNWDQEVVERSKDFNGCAVLYFDDPTHPGFATISALPFLIRRRLSESQGFVYPPYFPFWWIDTWLDEIGELTLRKFKLESGFAPVGERKTKGLREVDWWAKFFDRTRPIRLKAANHILDALPIPERLIARQRHQYVCAALNQRNQPLTRPGSTEVFQGWAEEVNEAIPERYLRAKRRAQIVLDSCEPQGPLGAEDNRRNGPDIPTTEIIGDSDRVPRRGNQAVRGG